ncbi:DUF6397 family protein [Streptomyces sp. NPDC005863]|uniref:DUF6397 family protein n=1 Tax=unclassified Streptomyces TaxID=2593676 RepID=UPI0033F4B8A3
MTGGTITQSIHTTALPPTVTPSRAARELELKRGEFDLAVMLGRVRTVGDVSSVQRRVTREEIERVRGAEGFPESLRESVRAVGTTEGAALMEIAPARLTRLARLGVVTPVKVYLNRYRAVVWLYLAEELRHFAESEVNRTLLKGRLPESMRRRLDEGQDLRARNWRGRYAGFLLRQADDAWERAAAMTSLLDPVQIAELVKDPYERAYLNRLKPTPRTHGSPDSPGSQLLQKIMTADDPDEIRWLRSSLLIGLVQARAQRPAPRPGQQWVAPEPTLPAAETDLMGEVGTDPQGGATPKEPGGLMKWLRRRRA